MFVNIILSTGLTRDKTIETRVLSRSLHPLHRSSLLSHFLLHSHFYPSHQLIQPERHMTLKLFQIYQLKDLKAHKELYLQLKGWSGYITVPLLYQYHIQLFTASVKGQLKRKHQQYWNCKQTEVREVDYF